MTRTTSNRVYYLTQAAMIAALYAILTYIGTAMDLSFGIFQFRFSEALAVLPIFTPAAIPGLAIGCFISNIASPFGLLDMVIGTSATLVAAILTNKLRNVCTIKHIPILSLLSPVLINALLIPIVIAITSGTDTFLSLYFLGFCSVGVSEFISCILLGVPLILILKNKKLYKKIFTK